MAYTEFIALHTSGVTAMRAYFDQAEKTATMLAKCTAQPLPFSERLIIASHEIVENTAPRRLSGHQAPASRRSAHGLQGGLLADVNDRPVAGIGNGATQHLMGDWRDIPIAKDQETNKIADRIALCPFEVPMRNSPGRFLQVDQHGRNRIGHHWASRTKNSVFPKPGPAYV